ncbi:adenylosuccinate lyase [Candidatus Daviesbacteria bacterium]|nr:adenylosuccinate lyase [Candidatus Daviesbacteria bacterium]
MKNLSTYQSPFSWRYGSDSMRQIWSEENKYRIWRKVWVTLAKAQYTQGLLTKKEFDDLEKHQDDINIKRILEIEQSTQHDVVAAIKEFAEKAKVGGGKIHLGATSMDINDNADVLRVQEALKLIEGQLRSLVKKFLEKGGKYSDLACMGYTHLQPAEPTTLGYRLCFYIQDLLTDLEFLKFVKNNLKGKGIKGAVGTSASYVKLLNKIGVEKMENEVMDILGISAVEISNQTAPRKIEYLIGSLLASISQTLYKFAFDLRIMQSPGFGEWQEPFGKTQVGSSAMPFKKNPWKAEQICSLSRVVVSLSRVLWDNAANMGLERTLDDSANRRVVIPEIFLTTDEILNIANNILDGLIVNEKKVTENLNKYWPFSVTEAILIEVVKKGADRQKMHEVLKGIAMSAWQEISNGEENPMKDLLENDPDLSKYLSSEELDQLFDVKSHLGNAPEKTKRFCKRVKKYV